MSSTAVQGFIKDIAANNIKAVQHRLAQQKAKPDQRYTDPKQQGCSYTLLHKAVEVGSVEITTLLLKAGADCNARDSKGRTCLHWLASCRTPAHLKIAELLLRRKGIDVHVAAFDNTTALHEAAALCNEALAALLIETGAARPDDTAPGYTPLDAACQSSVPSMGWTAVAGVLLQHAPQLLGQQDASGSTPLMALLRRSLWADALQLLKLPGDCNVNAKGQRGETALLMAIAGPAPCQQLVSALLAAGAAADAQDQNGNTALMAGIKAPGAEALQLVRLLASASSTAAAEQQAGRATHSLGINDVNAAGETALSLAMAAAAASPAAAAVVPAAGSCSAAQQASAGEQLLEVVLQQGPDLPRPLAVELVARGLAGRLTDAALAQVIRLLSDEDLGQGLSFASLLARKLYRSAAAVLVKGGSQPGAAQDAAGNTHLHLAVSGTEDAPELVTALLAVGVPADAQNSDADTALHLAARAGHMQVCCALVAGGANVLCRNHRNRVPGGQLKLPEATRAFLQEAEVVAKAAREQRMHDLYDGKMRATQTESAVGIRVT